MEFQWRSWSLQQYDSSSVPSVPLSTTHHCLLHYSSCVWWHTKPDYSTFPELIGVTLACRKQTVIMETLCQLLDNELTPTLPSFFDFFFYALGWWLCSGSSYLRLLKELDNMPEVCCITGGWLGCHGAGLFPANEKWRCKFDLPLVRGDGWQIRPVWFSIQTARH